MDTKASSVPTNQLPTPQASANSSSSQRPQLGNSQIHSSVQKQRSTSSCPTSKDAYSTVQKTCPYPPLEEAYWHEDGEEEEDSDDYEEETKQDPPAMSIPISGCAQAAVQGSAGVNPLHRARGVFNPKYLNPFQLHFISDGSGFIAGRAGKQQRESQRAREMSHLTQLLARADADDKHRQLSGQNNQNHNQVQELSSSRP